MGAEKLEDTRRNRWNKKEILKKKKDNSFWPNER